MVSILGLIAVIFIILAGPYRTFQKGRSKTWQGEVRGRRVWGSSRWGGRVWGGGAERWGSVLSVFSHANVSSAAIIFVGLHVLVNFQIGVGLTYIATLIFVLAFLSGLFGFFFTRTPASRRRWLWFHRRVTLPLLCHDSVSRHHEERTWPRRHRAADIRLDHLEATRRWRTYSLAGTGPSTASARRARLDTRSPSPAM